MDSSSTPFALHFTAAEEKNLSGSRRLHPRVGDCSRFRRVISALFPRSQRRDAAREVFPGIRLVPERCPSPAGSSRQMASRVFQPLLASESDTAIVGKLLVERHTRASSNQSGVSWPASERDTGIEMQVAHRAPHSDVFDPTCPAFVRVSARSISPSAGHGHNCWCTNCTASRYCRCLHDVVARKDLCADVVLSGATT